MAPDPLTLVTEAELQQTVEELFLWRGYLVFHTRDSRRSHPGFPDVAAIHPAATGPLYLLELKTAHGRLRPAQLRWGAALAAATSVRYDVIRPADLPRLVTELR